MAEAIVQRDISALAIARLIEQYKNSPKLIALLQLLAAEVVELQDAQWSILDGHALDDASGAALDVIGVIVGLPRPLIDATIFNYFGFATAPGATGFGDIGDPGAGGRFLSTFGEVSGQVAMEDPDYRLHIEAKIVRNGSGALAEDILEIVRLVIPESGPTTVTESGMANIQLTFGRELSTIELALVQLDDLNGQGDRLIPRCAGVSINYVQGTGVNAFSFVGGGGLGFGEGKFATSL